MVTHPKHLALTKIAFALVITYGSVSGVAHAQDWGQITATEQVMLQPLKSTWEQLPQSQRQQWLGRVNQLKNMTPEQRKNAQARMEEWASLSNQQRSQVNQQLKNDDQNNAKTRAKSWQMFIEQK
ncbi:hypothetical protein GCM10009007_02260 [Formosimonas limnophila]|uniref:DUF3106 domain-containing protein n=1 Tax=Formosimonas limnophila TaxID=1384487 RepID=A0A8J3FZR7_9BURK|nr:DUF3106 domain-containing protein [Formosimonas limnophila]GHA65292.1 hypothetical protein GCM10009007_02260 [Formosimonas limnophila]